MAKAKDRNKGKDLETRCRMAVDAILKMEGKLRDIEMELEHIIEFGRYKFLSAGKYRGKSKYDYDSYGKEM